MVIGWSPLCHQHEPNDLGQAMQHDGHAANTMPSYHGMCWLCARWPCLLSKVFLCHSVSWGGSNYMSTIERPTLCSLSRDLLYISYGMIYSMSAMEWSTLYSYGMIYSISAMEWSTLYQLWNDLLYISYGMICSMFTKERSTLYSFGMIYSISAMEWSTLCQLWNDLLYISYGMIYSISAVEWSTLYQLWNDLLHISYGMIYSISAMEWSTLQCSMLDMEQSNLCQPGMSAMEWVILY